MSLPVTQVLATLEIGLLQLRTGKRKIVTVNLSGSRAWVLSNLAGSGAQRFGRYTKLRPFQSVTSHGLVGRASDITAMPLENVQLHEAA